MFSKEPPNKANDDVDEAEENNWTSPFFFLLVNLRIMIVYRLF